MSNEIAMIEAMKAKKLAKSLDAATTLMSNDITNTDQASSDFFKQQMMANLNAIVQYINNSAQVSSLSASDLNNFNTSSSIDVSNNVIVSKTNSESFTWVTFNKTQLNTIVDLEIRGRTYIVLGANASKCVTVSTGTTLTSDFGQVTRWKLSGVQEVVSPSFTGRTDYAAVGDVVRLERKNTYYKLSIKKSGQSDFTDWFNVNFQQNATNIATEFSSTEQRYGVMKFTATSSEVMCKSVEFRTNLLTLNVGKWQGKVWNAIGDSITFQDGYEPVVKNALGLSSYRNYGKSGYTTQMLLGEEPNWDSNADLVTFFAGTNDFGRCDDLSVTQSSMQSICTKLKAKYPGKTIAIFLPLQRWGYTGDVVFGPQDTLINSKGNTLRQYCDVIKQVAIDNNIPVLDLYYLSGIDKVNVGNFTTDGLHPNTTKGYPKIANVMIDFLNSL
ncbi:SGNH/GDSL hydrolase family protein [Priestia megaterium]|uniref:SGNH/GDSL hydrolase family protein n=1 Tax=Priestia megaterium TaxID=1404 RepID=UPI00345AC246